MEFSFTHKTNYSVIILFSTSIDDWLMKIEGIERERQRQRESQRQREKEREKDRHSLMYRGREKERDIYT